jgi:uncharacterized protein
MPRRTGFVDLPLHPGHAPAWLFTRMTRLAREIATHVVFDRGPEDLLRRLSDRFWFQALGCVLGFDWHSGGVTTTMTGALNEGPRGIEHELGVYSQGGKGATSRNTPLEIRERCDQLAVDSGPLVNASRMGRQSRQRCCAGWVPALPPCLLLFRRRVIGADGPRTRTVQPALASRVASRRDSHEATCSDLTAPTLNLVAAEHELLRSTSVELASGSPDAVMNVVGRVQAAGAGGDGSEDPPPHSRSAV